MVPLLKILRPRPGGRKLFVHSLPMLALAKCKTRSNEQKRAQVGKSA